MIRVVGVSPFVCCVADIELFMHVGVCIGFMVSLVLSGVLCRAVNVVPRLQVARFRPFPECGFRNGTSDVDMRNLAFASVYEERMFMNLCTVVTVHPDPSVAALSPNLCGANFRSEVGCVVVPWQHRSNHLQGVTRVLSV